MIVDFTSNAHPYISKISNCLVLSLYYSYTLRIVYLVLLIPAPPAFGAPH